MVAVMFVLDCACEVTSAQNICLIGEGTMVGTSGNY